MAIIVKKDFPRIGRGFSVSTQIIPPSGLLAIVREIDSQGIYRFSVDGGKTYTDWKVFNSSAVKEIGGLTDSFDLVFDYVYGSFPNMPEFNVFASNSLASENRNVQYDKSIFKLFFDNDDERVLLWSMNVLEKLFSSGIVPLYIKRDNQDDYNSFFLAITQFFAYIVIYSRQFRKLEDSDLLIKEFIEGWGIVYENINSLTERQYLFNNWKNEFYKRGTSQIISSGEVIESELKRLVGYKSPNEFIFAILAPQDVGWCLGWSSPTWTGTETVNALSKGYDYGIGYTGENYGDFMSFSKNEITLDNEGNSVTNEIRTSHNWEIQIDEGNIPSRYFEDKTVGVNNIEQYPIIGSVTAEYLEDIYTLKPTGSGRSGISSEVDKSKMIEVYVGLDYEVTVWVRAESLDPQNIEFGVDCYNYNLEKVKPVKVTDFRDSTSFFEGDTYQSPCKVPGVYYQLRGIIYNVKTEKKPDFYLNFENGRPLRFMDTIKYMAPYVVQNREGVVSDIHIAGICVKPINLPFSQGYLGQKNVVAMYSTINTPRTKSDIEEFIKNYLVSYKNVMSYTWLDWVVRTSWFLTFFLYRKHDRKPVPGGDVYLSNDLTAVSDEEGYCRFELPFNTNVEWGVDVNGVTEFGEVFMDMDKTIEVLLDLPLEITLQIIKPEWGSVDIQGSKMPYSDITLEATPKEGYAFIKWVFPDEGAEDVRNPTTYWLSDKDITIQAIFERESILQFNPAAVDIPADEQSGRTEVTSSKKWAFDTVPEDWVDVSPLEGGEGTTEVLININNNENEQN